jgi:hypothetical protein
MPQAASTAAAAIVLNFMGIPFNRGPRHKSLRVECDCGRLVYRRDGVPMADV